MKLAFDTSSMDSYQQFLRLKRVPSYQWHGETALVPDQYSEFVNGDKATAPESCEYSPVNGLFDYQRDIAELAIRKRKFAVFADCGLGKTLILLEFARTAADQSGRKILIVAPLMVVRQTIEESGRFYDGLGLEPIKASELQAWLDEPGCCIGITNYDAIKDGIHSNNLGGLILDESSMLKSHYGAWGERLIDLGRGLDWKLCCTGTPAPNDRIEYANHSVFLDHFRTTNEFLARYFVNRGQTQERWVIKPHALEPFYRDLSHWCIFLSDPSVYGWKDNCNDIPPIHVHIDRVDLTDEQRKACQQITGSLMVKEAGGIGQRGKLSQIAKGKHAGASIATNKPGFIRNLVDGWPEESTIIWCHYNDEQTLMERTFPEAGSIRGETKHADREDIVARFKRGELKVLISKPKILGFGLNLQVATRQVFSGLQDSYEEFYQAVKRSNRVGSTRPLNVHVPVTEIEEPMVSNVLRKADRVQSDTEEQERLFKKWRWDAQA